MHNLKKRTKSASGYEGIVWLFVQVKLDSLFDNRFKVYKNWVEKEEKKDNKRAETERVRLYTSNWNANNVLEGRGE